VVVLIILVLAAITIPNMFSYKTLYKSEDQALKIMDAFEEASHLALSRRRNFRLELDLTQNAFLIIDENGAAADTLVKSIPLEPTSEVRIDTSPAGVTRPVPPDYYDVMYITDTIGHEANGESVIGNTVWAARFRMDGSVISSAGTPISSTLFIWPPKAGEPDSPRALSEVRALTLFGGSGVVRYWKYDGAEFKPN
jgi:hypothetical protein